MRKTRMQSGITLIALIITIIILLILAVVTIGSIKNSNIITYAQNASTDYEAAKGNEEDILAGYESTIKENLSGGEKITYKYGVPIPAGFYYVMGEKDTGLVISDSKLDENNEDGKDGNQFVWVPVEEEISTTNYSHDNDSDYNEPEVITGSDGMQYDNKEENLKIAECKENPEDSDEVLTADDFKVQLTKEYKEMAESVNKYNGFFVGRYETSMNGENAQSKYGAISATAEEESANMWYGLYALNKKYTTSLVKSSMIWGIQFEKMISWMGDKLEENISESNKDRICGNAPKDLIKNIYDLYGNSKECTLEAFLANNDHRVVRGGDYILSYSPRFHGYSVSPTTIESSIGSRMMLYIA